MGREQRNRNLNLSFVFYFRMRDDWDFFAYIIFGFGFTHESCRHVWLWCSCLCKEFRLVSVIFFQKKKKILNCCFLLTTALLSALMNWFKMERMDEYLKPPMIWNLNYRFSFLLVLVVFFCSLISWTLPVGSSHWISCNTKYSIDKTARGCSRFRSKQLFKLFVFFVLRLRPKTLNTDWQSHDKNRRWEATWASTAWPELQRVTEGRHFFPARWEFILMFLVVFIGVNWMLNGK